MFERKIVLFKEMERHIMKTETLEKHIFDTIKEWQMKIGYREESMKLYYPDISLIELLELESETTKEQLNQALEDFCIAENEKLGEIVISNAKDRYCIDVPVKGCSYIAKNVPDFAFLKDFLGVITTPGNTLEHVRACFDSYARENNAQYVEMDRREEGLGYVFFFDRKELDEYVYCIEADEFGLTYHRFTKTDYEKLVYK